MPVAHRSAISCSGSVIAGSCAGRSRRRRTTSSCPGRAVAAAAGPPQRLAAGRAPKQSKAPAVASASTWSADSPTRRARSAIEVNGPSRVARRRRSRSARSVPIVRTLTTAPAARPAAARPRHAHCDRPSAGLEARPPASDGRQRRPADLDAVPLGVVHQRLRRVEAHRLRVEQRRAERGRVVQLEPGRGVDQQREADRVALGEAERGERLDLLVDLVGDRAGDAVGGHAVVEPDAHRLDLVLGSLRAHRPAQLVGLGRA